MKRGDKIFYRKVGNRYELTRAYCIQTTIRIPAPIEIRGWRNREWFTYARLDPDGTLTIYAGYSWDGASGPAIDTDTIMRGSLVHDALYQFIRLMLLGHEWRPVADLLLKTVCLDAGMWAIRAEWVYLAVRTFAARSVQPAGLESALVEIGAP